jgi:hypothetical protein
MIDRIVLLLALLTAPLATALPALIGRLSHTAAQEAAPFEVGEELVYGVRSSRFGRIGKAHMRVAGPDTLRGRETLLLSFDFSAKVLLFRISDRTRSWFDPEAAASLRYSKRERSPLSDRDENVEIYPDELRWVEGGTEGELPTSAPLDELSFLYYLRTLPLLDGDVYDLNRHFDARRNPVTIRVAGRETRSEAAGTPIEGTYDVVVVDLLVPDARQEGGTTRIRLYLTDDAARVPVRLETSMPVGGTMVLELESRTVQPHRR